MNSASRWRTSGVYAMQKPLSQIALKVKKKIGNGVFMVSSTAPNLLIRQLIETSIDVVLGELHPLHRGGKKYFRDLLSHTALIIDAGLRVVPAQLQVAEPRV